MLQIYNLPPKQGSTTFFRYLSLLVMVLMLGVNAVMGQENITNNTAVVQNFNSIGSTTTASLPTGFKIGTDWSAVTATTATTVAYGTSGTGLVASNSTGGAVNWANGVLASSTDRSIGFLSTGTYTSPKSIIYAFTNNTGSTVTSLNLSWNYEKYRSGSRAFTWTFFHGNTSTATIAATAGDQFYAADANNTLISNPPLSVSKSFTITGLSIANGSTYYLKWTYTGDGASTNAQGLSIDDFSITLPSAITAPLAPTMGAITPTNQQLSVAFTAGSNGGSAITNYQYSTDGGSSFTACSPAQTTSPIVITGLTNGTSYNVQIRAVNSVGLGTATGSTAATPYTTPSAPTINSITPGNTQLSVAFTTNATGGSAITNYQYSTDGGATFLNRQTGTTASPIVITTLSSNGTTPLTNGTSYDVQIKAVNIAGTGAASSTTSGTPLAPVTPTITVNGTLASVNTTYGSASSNTSFTLDGATLTAGITVTPPVGFEVSTTANFSSSIGNNTSPLLVGAAPTVSTTTIYVRLLATATVLGSPYSGNIVLTSAGATDVVIATASSTVATRALTITGLLASAKTYDANTNVSVSGSPSFLGLQNGDLATVSGSPTFAFTNANAGSAKAITQTGVYGASFTSGVSANYTITQPTLTANINAVAITVTASAQSKNFGAVSATTGATSFTITSGTLVGSDNINTVTLTYSGSPAGNLATATAGTYTITPSAAVFSVGTTSSNYVITYNTGTLTINALTASAPTGIAITTSNMQLSVAFTEGSNGGSAITTYKYSTDGGTTFFTRQTGTTASPIVITALSTDGTTPLTNGVTYPIQIRAVTAFGDGTATSSTNATPNIVNSNVTAWINPSGTTAWHEASNWSPATIPSGSVVAQWNNTGLATGCGINLRTGIPSVLALEVGNSRTRSFLLGSSSVSGSMTLNGGVINNISDIIIRNSSNSLFTIAASNGGGTLGITIANTTNNKISVDSTGGITISLVIAGGSSNPLTKIGNGSGVLSLTGANTYTGLTTVTEGTLQLNRTGGTTIPNTNNVVINGGTLKVSSNQTLNDLTLTSGTLIIDAGVTLTINGTLTFTSGATINGLGTIVYGANAKLIYTGSSMQTTSSLEWPATNGPATVTVGSNGITLHANRAVTVELVLNGKLVIGSNTLTLAGILTGNGTLQGGNSSNITITGTGALGTLKMDQTSTVTSSVGVLVINRLSAGSVTIGDTLIVLESINIQNGTLQTGGKLKLASSLNKTAIIPAITGTGAISGNIQMQQFVKSSARRWRFISSPFTNATFEDLQQEIYITGAGNGSTLGTLNSNGFDATTSNRPSVYWYNESVAGDQKNGWVPLTNNTSSLANQPIVLGKGYRVFIRGDRSDLGRLSGATNNQNAVTLNLTGTIYTGDFNFNSLLTYTSTGSTGDGWNLLANPYPCGYDWRAFVLDGTNLSNIDPIIWIYDANSGGYKSYNANSGGTLKDGIIPPGASFWAKANAASPTMIFKESFKVTTEPDQLFKKSESDKLMLKLVFDSVTSDIFMLAHHNASLPTADVYDIRNMNGTITMMSKGTDGVELTYDARPLKVSNDTVQLWVSGGNSTYTILVNDVPTHGKFYYLKDKKLGESHLLSSGMVYNYSTLNSDSTTFGNRFELIISSSESLPVTYHYFKASIFNQHSLLEWGTASEINSHYFSIERSIDGTQWKEIGTRAAQGFSVTKHAYSYLDDAPVQGNINYYRLKQIDRNKQVTYSSIQLVNFIVNDVYSKVLLSPNPATSLFNIQSLVPIRCVTVMDMHGKVLLTSNAAEINIEDLVIGPYIVSIILTDGKVITQKLHKR